MFPKHFRLTPIAMVCAALCHSSVFAQEAVLPAVTVSGAADKPAVPESNRLGVSVQETPQAVTVIGADLIRAQNADRLEDVLRNVPGITQASGHSGIFSNYVSRGFQLDNTASYFKDGLRFNRQSEMSLQNIEQVEVIRGPASLQYGKLVPGGLINFVTKKPQAARKHEVTLYADQFGQIEGGIDTTGKLNESGSVLYRINAEAKKLESFRDHVDGNAYLISPAFTFKVSDATVIDLLLEHNRLDTLRDPGQPAPDSTDIGSVTRLDPSAFHGEKNADNKVRINSGTLRLNHRLNDSWQLRGDYSNSSYDRDMFFTFNRFNRQLSETSVPRGTRASFTDSRAETSRVETFGEFATGPAKHKLLAGVDRFERKADDITTAFTTLAAVDLFNPVPTGDAVYSTTPQFIEKIRSTNTGIYAQDQIDIGNLSVMVGVRHDRLKESYREDVQRFTNQHDNSQTSPSGGLMYRVLPQLALYASYSRSLDSNLSTDGCSRSYDPSRGTQYEAGAKGSALGDGLQWAVAAFDLTRSNGLADDPSGAVDADDNPCQVQGAKQRSTGVELEASGRITRGLRLHGSYTRLNARFTEDAKASQVGKKLKNAPEQSARLWAEYTFNGAWNGLSASLGMTYVGRRFANDVNTLTIPSYNVWDAGLRYAIGKADTIQVAVKNLTDRRYVEDAQSAQSINQGAPRTVSVRYVRTF